MIIRQLNVANDCQGVLAKIPSIREPNWSACKGITIKTGPFACANWIYFLSHFMIFKFKITWRKGMGTGRPMGRKTSKSGGERKIVAKIKLVQHWVGQVKEKPDFSFRPNSRNIAARGAGYGQIARVPGRR